MRRVVVTGIGLLSSIGYNQETTWNNLIAKKSGIKKINTFDVKDLSCKIGGYISQHDSEIDYYDPTIHLDLKEIKRNDRFIQYGIAAAKMAIEDSGINNIEEKNKLNVGVIVGSGIGGLETIYNGSLTIDNLGPKKLSPFFIPSSLINLLSGQISIKYGFKGPNHSVVTACATGAHSIGDAGEIIKRGAANVMVAGGSEAAVCKLGVAGFCAARSLSTSFNDSPELASRPWDQDRDGFVMGEGAGILVLEEYEHAKKRNAKIYSELVGYGMSGDAFHITSPPEDGDGGYRAMKLALEMANISKDEVDYINAHGTSTKKGDEIELNAISKLFSSNSKLKVSSTKSSIGHLLGAAGSVESIFSILSIKNNVAPATLNLNNPIETHIDLVAKEPQETNIDIALSNSFGFGGTNTALVFKKI
ncbi:MAG: beta-ketoacyl-[acyl-carrier-protein] synthase II [Pelagibacteraceae bacterium]|nr:beta-ketoacyl-[acyl-carrier-protein] synthase II [Pelagibacteraceae bacterium]|tara:strand:- start:14951 stop:16204 length:1254 start_codon:yes stop_codon:yes gene_type:complete